MVDTSKRSDAAPAKAMKPAAADLDASFGALRLHEDSSSSSSPRKQQPVPISQRRLQTVEALQMPVPPSARPNAMQQFEMVRQHWPQQAPSYAAGESSAAAAGEHASILQGSSRSSPGSSFLAPSSSHFGAYSPRLNPLAAQFPSVSSIMSHPLVPPPSVPSSNQYYQQTAMASASPGWDHRHNNNLMNPYAARASSAASTSSVVQNNNAGGIVEQYLSQLYANNNKNHNQAVVPWPAMMPSVPRAPTLAEVRARLLRGPMDPALVASPETAAHVERLLQEGGQLEVRRSVLHGVARAVHGVMQCREARDVFRALICACSGRVDELDIIVRAVIGGNGVLLDILKHDHGAAALKVLIMAVGQHPQLIRPLVSWLLEERLPEHCKCGEMVNHCFARMPYKACSAMIRFAIYNINSLLSSASGSIYLAECFANARDDELRMLEVMLLENTSRIATGQYSNYFMQRALECGSQSLKERIAERVAADVANLSVDKFGSYVVEACFLLTCSPAPMRRVLAAFLHLPAGQLADLVRGGYSNYVVHKLLAAGKKNFPEEATVLARRIEKLPADIHREMHAQRVMRVVKKLFPRKTHH
ncbi:hypothetical protein QOZ80_3BG0290990 [Eleusine coracana subsp. coracana]|nr:hypothetical protein QOZ80_3BG0290990 [Eleusine coracana subsp. coracana]